jgi:class 3 adenylate cyclase
VARCSVCGADNAAERRFCGACGVALASACAGCGFVNDERARFCGGCGVALPGRPQPAATAPERRQVAVLFVDLVGFTRLTSELGAEDTQSLLEMFFAAVDGVIERHGGTVDKHIGDCVMALFGAPLARGDDAERAVRAALAIRDVMGSLSQRLGRALEVHMGVAAGEVVAGAVGSDAHRTYTVTGDTVNFAARLTGLAAAGELLVSDAIRLALGGRAQLEDRGEVAIRGIPAPVRVHRLLGLADAPAEELGPLVGRQAELAQLGILLERARVTGEGEMALVRGEAGIGKTRLVAEMRALAAAQGFACHKALVLDFGAGEGRDAIRVLVRGLLGLEAADMAARTVAAAALVAAGDIAAALHPFLLDLLGVPLPPDARLLVDAMDESRRRRGRQEAVAAVLQAAARRAPVLLLVEDMHWAEADLLDDLAALAEAGASLPAVLVLTTRRDGDPIDAAWRGRAGDAALTTIDLSPLRDAEARLLARQLLAGQEERIVERCVARAQGNPLFLEQLLRHLRERQDDDAVPATVQSLVQARLDRLGADDRDALRAAAVLGQRFTLPGLRAVLGREGYQPGMLVRRFLIRPVGDGYLFAHALIRDAVYALLLRAQRRELHRRAAAFFAERDAVLHARHLDRAEDAAAPLAYAAAAEHQARAYCSETALELAARGLELARERSERVALACLTGRLLLDLGRAAPAEAAFATALAEAGDDGERCRARLGLAAAMRLADRLEEAQAQLDAAEPAAARQGLADELSRLHHLRGNLLFPLGRVEECARAHGAALAFARTAGSPELEARALGGLGDAEYARGRMLTAREAFSRCCSLAREHGFGRIEAANLPMLAATSWYLLDLAAILREAAAARDLALRVGHHRGAIIAAHGACLAQLLRLDLEEAEATFNEAQALTASIGARRFEAENLMFLAERLLLGGRRAAAVELAGRAMAVSRETAVSFIGPSILGLTAWASDDPGARRAALAEGEALLEQGSLAHNHLWFRRYAIEAALVAGDPDEALRQAEALERYTVAEPLPWSTFLAARGRALAAHMRNPRDPGIRAELVRLRDEVARLELRVLLGPLDAALAA